MLSKNYGIYRLLCTIWVLMDCYVTMVFALAQVRLALSQSDAISQWLPLNPFVSSTIVTIVISHKCKLYNRYEVLFISGVPDKGLGVSTGLAQIIL